MSPLIENKDHLVTQGYEPEVINDAFEANREPTAECQELMNLRLEQQM